MNIEKRAMFVLAYEKQRFCNSLFDDIKRIVFPQMAWHPPGRIIVL